MCLKFAQAYCEAGSPYKRQMDFQNIVNPPLLTGDPDQLVLDILNLPSLHCFCGIVDKLMTSFEENAFPSKEDGQAWMDRYLKKVIIVYGLITPIIINTVHI